MKLNYPLVNFYFAIAIAFLLPFKILISPVIACWLIFQFLNYEEIDFKTKFKKSALLLPIIFFSTHLLAYFFTENTKEALFSIELKLSFLILPFLVIQSKNTIERTNKILFAFVSANIIALLICTINSFAHFFKHESFLTYNEFCLFMHPSYFSMYLAFSVFILLLKFKELTSLLNNKVIIYTTIVFLISGIYFAASKMGILTFFILVPLIILIQLYKGKKFKTILLVAGTFILSSLFFIFSDSIPAARMRNVISVLTTTQNIDKTTSESNAVRLLIWKESFNLIKQKPILGYTPGDANDKLYQAYEQQGLTGALEKKLNAHNQFLQTSIGLGIFGFLLLSGMIFYSIFYGIKENNGLQLFFGLLIAMNFFVESMLQTSAGTIFFVFFYSLLNFKNGEIKS